MPDSAWLTDRLRDPDFERLEARLAAAEDVVEAAREAILYPPRLWRESSLARALAAYDARKPDE